MSEEKSLQCRRVEYSSGLFCILYQLKWFTVLWCHTICMTWCYCPAQAAPSITYLPHFSKLSPPSPLIQALWPPFGWATLCRTLCTVPSTPTRTSISKLDLLISILRCQASNSVVISSSNTIVAQDIDSYFRPSVLHSSIPPLLRYTKGYITHITSCSITLLNNQQCLQPPHPHPYTS